MKKQWKELKETIVEIRDNNKFDNEDVSTICKFLIKYMGVLEKKMQESCEMTVEEYRQRMIQAFHNADCDELIAICALPTEKDFEHLEWLLKKHYKKEPFIERSLCDSCVTKGCILQTGIIRNHCDFYKSESEEV